MCKKKKQQSHHVVFNMEFCLLILFTFKKENLIFVRVKKYFLCRRKNNVCYLRATLTTRPAMLPSNLIVTDI